MHCLNLRVSPCKIFFSPLDAFFRPKMTLVTKIIRSKRGFFKPHKLNNQSETSAATKEKAGETMVMRCLVDCCFVGVIWCLQWSKWGAVACVCTWMRVDTCLRVFARELIAKKPGFAPKDPGFAPPGGPLSDKT